MVLHSGRDVVRGAVMQWWSRDVADHMVGIRGGAVEPGGVACLQCPPVGGGGQAGHVGVMREEGGVGMARVRQRGCRGGGGEIRWRRRSLIRQVNEWRRGGLL